MYQQYKPTIKTKSAARLAAEAAFAPTSQSAEQSFVNELPAITVLHVKRATELADGTESAAAAICGTTTSGALDLPAMKVPRVFLLKSEHVGFGSTPSDSWPQREVHVEEAGAHFGLDRVESGDVRRTKRRRNRPPPVTLVFSAIAGADSHAAEVHCSDLPVSPAQAQNEPSAHSISSLAAALAATEPTFVAINAAMCFAVEDPQVRAQWEQISGALDQIAVEIRASSAKASAG